MLQTVDRDRRMKGQHPTPDRPGTHRGPATYRRPRAGTTLALALAACLAAGAVPARAADACAGQPSGNPLVQPRVIRPVGGTVNTSLTIRMVDNPCIPKFDSTSGQWGWESMKLRTYGSPADGNNPDDPNLLWTIPGPTYRIKKALVKDDTKPLGPGNPQIADGTRFRLSLRNELPNNSYPYDKCQPAEVLEPPPTGCEPNCDQSQKFTETSPECFHGADVTNIHYHGTHVSPQPHQDFVLLELFSSKQTNPPPPPPGDYVAIGSYQTDMNPIPWNQAPGTHWYHPHKHGSTALQVLNGMAGALLIQGPFDDWLYGLYGVDPTVDKSVEAFEKVMVVQQVWPDLNFYHKPHPDYPPPPLVDGQAEPIVTIRYGEVQRWRMIGATMQAAAQLKICFTPLTKEGFAVKQIAQDGVQFAPENYQADPQPLIVGGCYLLAPGNRGDFLVQAPPKAPATRGPNKRMTVTFEVFGNVADEVRQQLQTEKKQRLRSTRAPAEQTALTLFSVDLAGQVTPPQSLPSTWPAMPYYLRDITKEEVAGRQRTIAFSMTDPTTGVPTTPGTQRNGFWIDKTQYDPDCANQTMAIGTAEQWLVTNDSGPNHPFHIHINPFQVLRNDTTTYAKPIWQDTISLPSGGCADVNAGPIWNQRDAEAKCPGVCSAQGQVWNGNWKTTVPGQQSVCGCCTVKSVEFRSRFEDYTGGYVYHCHFLGHEDRGMMNNVQTVCPAGDPDQWHYGSLSPDGLGDDCSRPASLEPLPACKGGSYKGEGGATSHH
jgi:FtsP/CotA-like multicopper oxidase with cupredoxin domain